MPTAARNLALAHHLAQLIDKGLVADCTTAARVLVVSQPRLTHLMSLLLLAPQIQDAILAGTIAPQDKQLSELARIVEWREQLGGAWQSAVERVWEHHARPPSARR